MVSKLWILLVLMITVGPSAAHAQQQETSPMEAELSLVWGLAHGSLADNIKKPMPGVIFSVGGRVPRLPLVLSTEFGMLYYGFDDRTELRQASGTVADRSSITNTDVRSSVLMGHLVAKVAPFKGVVSPYIDGLVGLKYFNSRVKVERITLSENSDNRRFLSGFGRAYAESRYNTWALSYGIGVGTTIRLVTQNAGTKLITHNVKMHLGMRYLFGLEADYLAENAIISTDQGLRFEQRTSYTDLLMPQIGIRFGL
jgi:hypothetical protein